MNYDLHFTKARMVWALSLVGHPDSRTRAPDWYSDDRVIAALEGMMAGQAPPASFLAGVCLTDASLDDVLHARPELTEALEPCRRCTEPVRDLVGRRLRLVGQDATRSPESL